MKALKIIGVDEVAACSSLSIHTLNHRRQVAAVTTLYKMHTSVCPYDLQAMLPLRMLDVMLLDPVCLCKTMLSPFQMLKLILWTEALFTLLLEFGTVFPEYVVREITDNGLQVFKCRVHGHLLTYGTL